jgi:hypothetical protein
MNVSFHRTFACAARNELECFHRKPVREKIRRLQSFDEQDNTRAFESDSSDNLMSEIGEWILEYEVS